MSEGMAGQLARDIEILADLFNAGGWSEIRLESKGLSVLLSTDRTTPSLGSAGPAAPTAPLPATTPAAASVVEESPVSSEALPDGAINPDWSVVLAPNLGTSTVLPSRVPLRSWRSASGLNRIRRSV